MEMEQFEVETDKPVFVQFPNPFTGEPLYDQMDDPENPGERINDPTKPVGVNLFGRDSEPFAKRRRWLLDSRVAAAQKGGSLKQKPEDMEKSNADTVTACIHSFVNVKWQGEDLAERRDLYPLFFKKHNWAFEFCNTSITDRANFQKASQTA